MLVRTSLNDSQVMYWEPAKYVARLRALRTDGRPLLFKINMGAGHGGASGRYDFLREIALRLRLHPARARPPPAVGGGAGAGSDVTSAASAVVTASGFSTCT